MDTLEFYIDESYNSHLFCVGGFLARVGKWNEIKEAWRARIEYENRRSATKGFPPISRYHATDCANLKREFDSKNGWDVQRQIRLTKRFCKILGKAAPSGIVVGGRISDMRQYLEDIEDCPKQNLKESLYDICFRTSLLFVVGIIRERFPGSKVKVIYDHGKNFGSVAERGFQSLQCDDGTDYLQECLTELVPEDSRKCTQLQSADFLAYEAMKRLDGVRRGENVRKSLQALIGTEIPLHIPQFTEDNFADIRRMIDNQKNGRPIEEGVKSGLAMSVDSGHPISPLR